MKRPTGSSNQGRRSTFGTQVAMLAGSAAVGQVLLIVASPVLTRLFSPAEFGTYTLFTAAVTIITVISSLRYELAIPLSRSHSGAANVMTIAFSALLVTTAITAVASLLFHAELQHLFDIDAVLFFWLLPVAVLLAGTQQVLSNWAIRKYRFGVVTQSRLAMSFAAVATQLSMGALRNPSGLLAGQTVGYLAGSVGLGVDAIPQFATQRKHISIRRLRSFAVRYRRFPLYSTWSGLSTSFGVYAPVIILTAAFGPAIAGLYGLATRVLQMPMVILGSALSQVFFSHVARESSANRSALIGSVFEGLLRVGSAPMLLLAYLAPSIFSVVFGSDWFDAGVYARWLAPLSLLAFVASPVSVMPSVLERQRSELQFQGALLVVRIGAMAVGIIMGSPLLAVVIFSGGSCFWWLAYLDWNFRESGINPVAMLRVLVKEILLAAVVTTPALLGILAQGSWPAPVCIGLVAVGILATLFTAVSTLRHFGR